MAALAVLEVLEVQEVQEARADLADPALAAVAEAGPPWKVGMRSSPSRAAEARAKGRAAVRADQDLGKDRALDQVRTWTVPSLGFSTKGSLLGIASSPCSGMPPCPS